MKYLLTEKEFKQLHDDIKAAKTASEDTINHLCKTIADKVPQTDWRTGTKETPRPWGCIHSETKNVGYCDECPAQDYCGMDQRWSK